MLENFLKIIKKYGSIDAFTDLDVTDDDTYRCMITMIIAWPILACICKHNNFFEAPVIISLYHDGTIKIINKVSQS